jgi:hypothetical protein
LHYDSTKRDLLSVSAFLLGRRDRTLAAVGTRKLQERRGKSKWSRSLDCGFDRSSELRCSASKKKQRGHGQTTSRENLRSRRSQGTCKPYDTASACGLGHETRPSVFTTRAVLNLMHRGWILPVPRILPGIPAHVPQSQSHALLTLGTRCAVDSGVTRSLAVCRMREKLV